MKENNIKYTDKKNRGMKKKTKKQKKVSIYKNGSEEIFKTRKIKDGMNEMTLKKSIKLCKIVQRN